MRLTAKKAVQITREAWRELALTGAGTKEGLVAWEKYGKMISDCPLCEYRKMHGVGCEDSCPLFGRWGEAAQCLDEGSPYDDWKFARSKKARKAAAQSLVNLCDKWLEEHKQ